MLPAKLRQLTCSVLYAMAQSPSHSAESEIRAARKASNEAIQRKDIRAFAASLDTDFTMIRGNGVLVPSRQAYIDFFAAGFANPRAIRYERVPGKIEISNAAPLAAEHGHWTGMNPDGGYAECLSHCILLILISLR